MLSGLSSSSPRRKSDNPADGTAKLILIPLKPHPGWDQYLKFAAYRMCMIRLYVFILLFFSAATAATAQSNPAQDDSMIRASRIKTNELIANHDLKGLSRYWLKDYVRIAGNGNVTIGKDSSLAYWDKFFKTQPDVYYKRTTNEVIISENGTLAWESGTWEGFNTKSKGGSYAAMWSKQDNIWKLQSELYVTLYYY